MAKSVHSGRGAHADRQAEWRAGVENGRGAWRQSRSRPPLNARASLRIRSITSSWVRCCRAGGQIPARQAAFKAGIPNKTAPPKRSTASAVPACARSIWPTCTFAPAITTVDRRGGMESMTNAPYLLRKARGGYRMGDGVLEDMMITDGLSARSTSVHHGTPWRQVAAEESVEPRRAGRLGAPFAPARDRRAGLRPFRRRDRAGRGCAKADDGHR